jgi:hypothetical protein
VSFRNGSGPEAAATVLEARKNVGIGKALREFAGLVDIERWGSKKR